MNCQVVAVPLMRLTRYLSGGLVVHLSLKKSGQSSCFGSWNQIVKPTKTGVTNVNQGVSVHSIRFCLPLGIWLRVDGLPKWEIGWHWRIHLRTALAKRLEENFNVIC